MFCRGSIGLRAWLCGCVVALATSAQAQTTPPSEQPDGTQPQTRSEGQSDHPDQTGSGSVSSSWEMHFEHLVDAALIRPELARTLKERPAVDEGRARRTLDAVVRAQVEALPHRVQLPASIQPALILDGASQPAIAAIRAYGAGDEQAALEQLLQPDLLEDPSAAHLRAQLQDTATQGALPSTRLAVVDAYRHALRLQGEGPMAERARLRIAQLLLEVRFYPEARAEVRTLLADDAALADRAAERSESDSTPDPGARKHRNDTLDLATRVTLAEAAFLDRDPERTLLLIRELAQGELPAEVRAWAISRNADSLYGLQRFRQSALSYALLEDEAGAETLSTHARLRHASALIEIDETDAASQHLEATLQGELAPEAAALAQLLLSRARRQEGQRQEALDAADAARRAAPGSDLEALAAAQQLDLEPEQTDPEGRSALDADAAAGVDADVDAGVDADVDADGDGDGAPPADAEREPFPEGTAALVRDLAESPARAMLGYFVERARPASALRDRVVQLGRLHRRLAEGAVRELVRLDLSRQVGAELAAVLESEAGVPDPEVLTILRRYLGPHHLDENSLLLAVEAFHRAGDAATCGRWASLLWRRDVRPIRRGIGAWREIQCKVSDPSDAATPQRLLELVDSGTAGPFSLPLAVRAAEHALAAGDERRARAIYVRALESFSEPSLLGPVLFRVAQLLEARGELELASRHILRGLRLTESLRNDPLRLGAIVALARITRTASKDRLRATLVDERRHVEGWWRSAYDYLAFRAGVSERPQGETLFARAGAEIRAVDELAPRIERLSERIREQGERRGRAR